MSVFSKKPKDGGIKLFRYNYHASPRGSVYTLEYSDGEISAEYMDKPRYGKMISPAPEGFADALEKLCAGHRVDRWNGFDKINKHVLDGSGFGLTVEYADGRRIAASGSNACPRGYGDFVGPMRELFRPEEEKMLEKRRREIISKGVTGDPESILAVFKQRGASGYGSMKLMVSKPGIRPYSFELEVKSDGSVFPEGDLRTVDNPGEEALRLDRFGELARSVGLINWFDFHGHTDDPDNSEWFQISFHYADGEIGAMGTAKPEGYDVFRRGMFEIAKEIYDEIEKQKGE